MQYIPLVFPTMYTVVFTIIADSPISLQTIFVPFRFWFTGLITSFDSRSACPSSDILEKVNTVEFISTLSGYLIVDERVRVILSPAILYITFHVKKLRFVLQVTFSSSPTLHTAALGDGNMTIVPI